MKRYFQIYKEQIIIEFKSAMAYRLDFILSNLITLISNILLPLVSVLIYRSGASFEGWTLWEVLLLQSIYTISLGITATFFSAVVWITMRFVQDGTLEIVLLKPLSCLGGILSKSFQMNGLSVIAGGLILFVLALIKSETHLNLFVWLQFLILFLAGILVSFGIVLFMAATSFKWVANSRIPELYESVEQFGRYPQTIFPKVISTITSFVFPVAMIGYFPASVLLGQAKLWMFLAILPCMLFLLLGIYVYQHMVKCYESVGG